MRYFPFKIIRLRDYDLLIQRPRPQEPDDSGFTGPLHWLMNSKRA